MSPFWRTLLLAGVAAGATQPAIAAGGYGGGFIEFVMTGGPRAQPRDPFAPRPHAVAPQAQPMLPPSPPPTVYPPVQVASYGTAPTEARRTVPSEYLRTEIDYPTSERPGTIVVDTRDKHLYLVQDGGRAIRYGIGVGRPGFTWSGVKAITRKAEWPDWTPPPEMLKRRPDLPKHMAGCPENPLGARALYLGSSLYRIHGTNEPYTIGQNVSSGCIRMMNGDVEDLYGRVKVGTKVVVL
jgi:lipoprotein-anchoring transpeptidase ErfK/SrfK